MNSTLQHAEFLAQACHQGQRRKNGDPYFEHCKGVFERVRLHGLEEKYQKAAFLHDVLENTSLDFERLAREVGVEVAEIVQFLSKKPKKDFSKDSIGYNQRISEYIARLKQGAQKYPGIPHIKLCDQIDNLNNIYLFSEQKYYRIIWTIEFYYLPFYDDVLHQSGPSLSPSMKKSFEILYRELASILSLLLDEPYQAQKSLHLC